MRGYTFIELLCTLAALVIVLGVVVSLSRAVRNESRQSLTRVMLRDLSLALDAYAAEHGPPVPRPPLLPPDPDTDDAPPSSQLLLARATANNRAMITALRPNLAAVGRGLPGGGGPLLGELPDRFYDGRRLLDAWGTPVILTEPDARLGLGAAGGPFFVSAGADADYLTRGDNLYSYEVVP
ncbi:MAG: type II secretion system protein [Phycisphaerae bacterium]